MAERFILQPSDVDGYWVVTDTHNHILIIFKNHHFNTEQEVKFLQDFNADNYMQVAKIMREFGDWIRENHYKKAF